MRVSDAQCLAAANASANSDTILVLQDNAGAYVIYNETRQMNLHRTYDKERAGQLYQLEFFRPIIEAALNIV